MDIFIDTCQIGLGIGVSGVFIWMVVVHLMRYTEYLEYLQRRRDLELGERERSVRRASKRPS